MTSTKLPTAVILAASILCLVLLPATGKNIKTLFDTGVDFYVHRQYRLSLRALQEVLAIEPKFKEALILKGRCHLRLDEPQLALSDFNAAIKLDANSADAFLYRAEAYCNLESPAKAIADCTRSLSLKRSQRCYHVRGKLFLQTGEYVKALADLDQAIKLGAVDANMLLDRADALVKQRKYQEAVRDCTQALNIRSIENVDTIRAYRCRSSAFESMGKKDLALKDRKILESKFILEWGQP